MTNPSESCIRSLRQNDEQGIDRSNEIERRTFDWSVIADGNSELSTLRQVCEIIVIT